ncbi:hypothetical protein ES319_A01G005900v1 [Gossypium barbadense]|uniref:Uncharacterized protein n=3 Tax=Gossypium TaxID=3633 RepID=A0A5J5WTF4_GOSBA|nr:hypothetical protein ES319_A01G005900v1 [Gossypium barbadense]TYH29402.1 hypothetical protein ES288_A01G008400v1 [Gossypium darwinii]TYI41265.1 hypothetical protein ES332_A01G007900v1 [Gossypium tomentosum]
MEVEVVAPLPTTEFNFDSSCSSPYITAPSSPQRFGGNLLFSTAPTSPSHDSSLYGELNGVSHVVGSSPAVPFEWEPKQSNDNDDGNNGCGDFEFNFSGQLERTSLSADELFDGGKIKPLKPPHLFEPTAENHHEPPQVKQEQRGRERKSGFSFSSSTTSSSSYNYNLIHKKSRSLSPFRVTNIILDEQDECPSNFENPVNFSSTKTPKSYVSSIFSAISFQRGNKKWKLRDLLLFRSASEGRATNIKEPLRKYSVLGKKEVEDVKHAPSSTTASSKRRTPPVSAHELHYTVNRAVAEEMRRKTFLPYKQGLLGCLGFNPGSMHEISRGVGSLTRG